ncbi:hypothetical protein IIC_03937 [Bacillus cereus VD021]|uniref:Glycosyltransferase n=1 Tax=Bacillus cereus VD021 TaxID=1053224 RepID=R8HJL0_BACCE|nr:glycosyltransferase family 4 protein [Bacillus cereus]EOO73049.1 hypothetical protein IIC_03937 [Bacillus cereus VD021]
MEKIVFICEALGGGVRRHLVDVLSNLDLNKYEVHVIHGTKRVDEVFLSAKNTLEKKGIYFYEFTEMVRELSVKNDIVATKSIIKLIRKIRPEIVHCHSSKAGAIGRIAARICGVKKIYYTPHAYVFQNPNLSSKKKFLYKNIEKILGLITTKVLHVSEGEEAFALDHKVIPLDKSAVVYNGISQPSIETNFSLKDLKEKLVIGTIARMDYQKNPWLFIHIAEQVIRENKNVEFIYIGDGEYYNEISDYITDNNLNRYIKLKGFQSNPDVELMNFDVFISTSLYEGMPYSLIEALSYKKPIIATNVVGNNEIVIDDYNGYLFDKDNAKEGTQKILEIIKDPSLYDKLSKNGFRTFEENFTIEKMLSSIESVYSK